MLRGGCTTYYSASVQCWQDTRQLTAMAGCYGAYDCKHLGVNAVSTVLSWPRHYVQPEIHG